MENTDKAVSGNKITCRGCGAYLKYKPGTQFTSCEYCGFENEIVVPQTSIEEHDYLSVLNNETSEETLTAEFIKCESCQAISTLNANLSSAFCPYCTSPLIIGNLHTETIIQPKSVLPFKFDQKLAKEEFSKWIRKLWFAPNNLKQVLSLNNFKGIYIPYWTFDTDTYTAYTGERGEYYYVTENYTTTEDGKQVTRTREVRRTRWYDTSGAVDVPFDDLLVIATRSLPEKQSQRLEPWDLENLVPFDESYLSGFITEKYQINLEEGFDIAKELAVSGIESAIRDDIGGDEQHISSMETTHSNITFKHLLFPVYVSAYKYNNKLYQFLINGRTGEVQGQRPYSWIKIVLFSLAILILIYVLTLVV